ncbi:MAG TPA: glycosyltransferase family 4 protein, partial [Sedimentisphaerales bacterium]|nr:glycosyltransferase family 4 protein [Sedimentisphaerales bacterium]
MILALHSAGWAMGLISWRDVITEDSGLAVINSVVERYIEESMGAVRPKMGWRTPGFAQAREVTDDRKAEIVAEARRLAPDLILSIGLYGASLGVHIAQALDVPHVYRSQAIEHDYYAHLFDLERKRISRSAVRKALRSLYDEFRERAVARVEEFVLGSSALVLEISAEDAEIRRSRCGLRIEHFPPCAPEAEESLASKRSIDVLYLGNLFMENNRIGLLWFLDEVLPMLRQARRQLRIVVAGKSTDRTFERLIAQAGVVVLPNVADADALFRDAKVAVNPIFSGNGTNVKTIDALWFVAIYWLSALVLFAQADTYLLAPLIVWFVAFFGTLAYFVPRLKAKAVETSEARSMLTGRIVDSYTNILTVSCMVRKTTEV